MIHNENKHRQELNELMFESDSFFKNFAELDNLIYSENVIPKKYKELQGLSISIISKCNECILYHIQECVNAGASKEEIIETIKIAVIGGGSVLFPNARYAFKILKELNMI